MSTRRWVESYSRSTRDGSSAVISIIAHALVVGAAVAATNRPANLETDWIANRVYYLPPPDNRPSQEGSREKLAYIELAPEGTGSGFGKTGDGADPIIKDLPSGLGDIGRDLTTSIDAPKLSGYDSVFTQLEVDSIVTRYPGSAAPQYPEELVKEGVQGSVVTQFVVDTTGLADSASLKIVRTTNVAFAQAVRAALPYMRFFPAKVGSRKVRQLVEQEFSFKIEQAALKHVRPPQG
jgi:protein TonB